ncbi:MAG TPA: hypothetical protein VK142_07530 [Bacillota bacterium]|nr:hypothetical protein [Bacillota bacterium]
MLKDTKYYLGEWWMRSPIVVGCWIDFLIAYPAIFIYDTGVV